MIKRYLQSIHWGDTSECVICLTYAAVGFIGCYAIVNLLRLLLEEFFE